MTRVLQKGTTRRRQNLKEIRANPVSCSLTATISLWGLSAKRIRSRKNIHAQLKRRFWWHPRENRHKNQSQLVSFFFFVRIDETKWASGSLGVGVGPEIGREVVTNERENGGSGRIIHNYLGNAKHCVVPSHIFFKIFVHPIIIRADWSHYVFHSIPPKCSPQTLGSVEHFCERNAPKKRQGSRDHRRRPSVFDQFAAQNAIFI